MRAVVEIKLSDSARSFLAAALDLLQAVEESDEVLVTDDVLAKAQALRRIVERGNL